jgi:hypothetical protein
MDKEKLFLSMSCKGYRTIKDKRDPPVDEFSADQGRSPRSTWTENGNEKKLLR